MAVRTAKPASRKKAPSTKRSTGAKAAAPAKAAPPAKTTATRKAASPPKAVASAKTTAPAKAASPAKAAVPAKARSRSAKPAPLPAIAPSATSPVDAPPPAEPPVTPSPSATDEHAVVAEPGVQQPPAEETLPEPMPVPRRPGLIPTEVADALTRVLSAATAAIRSHDETSRTGEDIEGVHQMRVATRRIRAYLKAADPALDHEAADQVRTDLKDLADALGAVRDLDVMIERLHKEASALKGPDTVALERLIGSLDADRNRARAALVAVLDDPDHDGLLAELDATAQTPPVANPWADLDEIAAHQWHKLDRARGRMHRAFGIDPPDDDLHNLRIYGKRARYTAELLPKNRQVTAFLSALADFQEVLGDHQDATVLEERLREMVGASNDPAAGLAAGRVVERCRLRRIECRAAYPAAWAAVHRAATAAFGH